jgi:serine/threonine-protein kinase
MTRLIRGGHHRESPGGTLQPGTRIGDYKIVEPIAVGGFGAVYHVEHTLLGRHAALKILHRELGSSSDAARRFEREAKAVNIIQHPNVVDVFDFGYLADGQPYFVMELLTGEDLQTRIEHNGRLTVDETIATLEPLCSALDAAHANGIVHRDIKASNVFRQERPHGGVRIVLLDFGVAKLLFDASGGPATSSQIALGTPACMAPEQIIGGEVSARTDTYALGALTFHMLTGALPFSDSDITMMQQMHMHAQRPRLSAIVPALQTLDEVIAKAMSRNVEERYATASELLEAVRGRTTVSRTLTPRLRLERGVAVHLEILVEAMDLEDPDESLVDAIEAVGSAWSDALRAARFEPILDASTTVLFVRVVDGDEATQVADTVARARELLRRPVPDPRIAISVVIHTDSVLAAQNVAKGGALLQLAAWIPTERVVGLVAQRRVVDGLDLEVESMGGDLVRILH